MTKTVWRGTVALLVSLSLAAPAFAQGTPGGKAAAPAKPAAPMEQPREPGKASAPGEPQAVKPTGEKEAAGKVISVSQDKKTLVVDAEGKKMTFGVADPAAMGLSKLKRGDRVKVRYTGEGDQLTAQEVTKG